MIEVDVESIARGDKHIGSSFTKKAIAPWMRESAPVLIRGLWGWWEWWMEYGQLIVDSQQNSMDDGDDDDDDDDD